MERYLFWIFQIGCHENTMEEGGAQGEVVRARCVWTQVWRVRGITASHPARDGNWTAWWGKPENLSRAIGTKSCSRSRSATRTDGDTAVTRNCTLAAVGVVEASRVAAIWEVRVVRDLGVLTVRDLVALAREARGHRANVRTQDQDRRVAQAPVAHAPIVRAPFVRRESNNRSSVVASRHPRVRVHARARAQWHRYVSSGRIRKMLHSRAREVYHRERGRGLRRCHVRVHRRRHLSRRPDIRKNTKLSRRRKLPKRDARKNTIRECPKIPGFLILYLW